MRLAQAAAAVAWIAVIGASRGTDYYVSPRGDDAAPGTIRRTWKSIDRVNRDTIFNSKGAGVAFGGDPKYATPQPRMTFRNNIFVSGEAQIEGGSEKGRFEGNLYWAMGDGGFLVDGYKSFDAWVAATGQDKIGGVIVGHYADPLLRKNGTGLLTDPSRLATLSEYQILPGSPAIDAGLDLREGFKINPGMRDFYGNAIPWGKGYDIGAHEFTGPAVGEIPKIRGQAARRVCDPISSMLVRWSGHAQ